MKPVARHSDAIAPSAASVPKPNRPTSRAESVHRLHPGHSRRVSDSNHSASPSRSAHAPRTSSLAAGTPPIPALPPMQFGTAITTPDMFSSTASNASSVTMVPVASSTSLAGKAFATPTVVKGSEVEAPRQAEVVTPESSSEEEAAPTTKTPAAIVMSDSPTKKGRRAGKVTRFTELETIKSNSIVTIEAASPAPPVEEDEQKRRPTTKTTALPTEFDESVLSPPKEAPAPAPSKPGKLSKSAGPPRAEKLVKKNRWSLRSSKSTAVAV